jgi:hypothetical protein
MALPNETTFGHCGTFVAKLAHSAEVWNSTDLDKNCEATQREAEDSDPLRVDMGAFALVSEYKTNDPFQLPWPGD